MVYLVLLLVCLLATSALASTQLTEANIKLKTSAGNWLVFYYHSTSISHTFESTWEKLAMDYNGWIQHGVYFGKVNCSTEKSICDNNNDIIKVFSNGNVISTNGLDDNVTSFLKQQIISNPLRGSVSLTKDDLTIIEASGHPWFVKFYAPWCGHCKNLAPIWDSLAQSLDTSIINVGEVNCETDRDLCSSQKVTGLPTLKFYNGETSFIYKDGRDLDSFQKYLIKMTGPTTRAIDHSSLASIYENPVSLVYAHKKGDDLTTIQSVAKKYMDSVPFYTTDDSKVMKALDITLDKDQATSKAVLIKDGGALRQIYSNDIKTEKHYIDWVDQNKYPLVTRINSGNANDILKGEQLVALMFLNSDMAHDGFRQVSREWLVKSTDAFPRVIFAELNGQVWAKYVKRVYDISSNDLPTLVIVNPKNKTYYNQDLKGKKFSIDDAASLFEALQHTEQLESHTTEPPRSVSMFGKTIQFLGDHSFVFAVGFLALVALLFTIAGASGQEEPSVEKKND
ncbi:uncharacterized protein BX664DRAFT_293891 [Halteromyces radiatus]|uniref:uncharacterized protein n=1 Tax=Halteromyces radiatus TaxID=101107 RepID=UPI00221E7936|nr:uncharacterized protein BX664DRAFT_293891 [Halteromyces radiatus]KAI8092684.1 hypothetical protein BX664DRAFT_293891 [Halteromyces radiatus]